MKKLLLAVVALGMFVFATNNSFAQNKLNFGVGGNLLLPIGNFSNGYSIGFGGTVRGQYMINEMFSLMATSGFLSFSGKDLGGGVKLDNATMIPILVGGKYYFTPSGTRFYGAADLGISIFKVSVSTPAIPAIPPFFAGSPGGSVSASSSEFTFQPQLGLEMPMGSGNTKLDLSAAFALISNANCIGARIGLIF